MTQKLGDLPTLYSLGAREIRECDAEYVYGLRTDETYNNYLSRVDKSVDAQRRYIRDYLSGNEAERTSFYFILDNKATDKRCGTVRIYNFDGDGFEWGSWILDENKPRCAALETAIFIYEYAFNSLGFSKSEFEVNKRNTRVISYHQKSGAKLIGEDETNFYFRISKATGLEFARKLRRIIEPRLR